MPPFSGPDDKSLTVADSIGILLFGASMLLIGLGSARVLTFHETLFAQPAKEMLATGDWIVPRFAGIPSNHKPPLTHWSIALSMALFGSDTEWVVRLPAVLAALGTALLVAQLGARAAGRRIGLLAGLMQLTTFYTLMQARLAESDMLLCLWVTAALVSLALGADATSARGRRLAALVFHGSSAAALLTKGPLGLIFIGGGALGYLVCRRDRTIWRLLFDPAGLIVLIVGVCAWPTAALLRHPAIVDDWRQHHLGRFAGALGGQKPPFFYWYMTPLLLLPWTPFVLSGLWRQRDQRNAPIEPGLMKLLIAWFAVGFAVLSLSSFKHKHYLIPLLPPFSIVAGSGLEWLVWGLRRRPAGWRAQRTVAAGLFATAWLAAVAIQTFAMPHFDSYRDQADLARRVNETVAKAPLVLAGLPENQITYYLTPPLVRIDGPHELEARLRNRQGDTFILAPRDWAKTLAKLGAVRAIDRCASIRKIMVEGDRLTLYSISAPTSVRSRYGAAPSAPAGAKLIEPISASNAFWSNSLPGP